MKKGKLITMSLIAVMLFSMAFFEPRAYAALTKLLSYHGRLLDGSGSPVPNGTYSFTFSLYNVSSGGSALWSETQNLNVENGGYSAYLGSVNPLTISFTEDYWLGIKVASDPEMTPRLRIAMVGNAIYALDSEKLGGQTATNFAIASHTHTGLTATNSDTVDNFHASATPTASTLLPLDSSAKFPASVLPPITSSEISDGTIANADISSSAAIADTKLATISSSGKVSDTALSGTNWSALTGSGNTTLHTHNSLPSGATIGSANVCLQNGTNCPVAGGSVALSPTANQIIDSGTAAITPLTINGGYADPIFEVQKLSQPVMKVNWYGGIEFGDAPPPSGSPLISAVVTGPSTSYNDAGSFVVNDPTNAGSSGLYVSSNAERYGAEIHQTSTSTMFPAVYIEGNSTNSEVLRVENNNPASDETAIVAMGSTGFAIAGFSGGTGSTIYGNAAGTGNLLQLQKSYADQFVVTNSGKVTFATGANKPVGTGTVTSGTNCATVSNTLVTTGSIIMLTIETTNTSITALKIKSKTAGTGFAACTLDETNAAQNIPFNYLIVN